MKKKLWSEEVSKKLVDPEHLEELVAKLRKSQKKIVTLNGSFDLMHAGHLQMIYEASLQGDVLILALNTDSSIKRYKSEKRPIIPLKYRVQMMAAIGFVDYVTWFDETDPRALLEKIRPDVHANGSEYGPNCIEAEVVKKHGGNIYIVSKIPGLSTSEIIAKIANLSEK